MPMVCFGYKGFFERPARRMCQQLSIRKCKVCGGAHCTQVCLAFRRIQRRADQFPVGQVDAILADCALKGLYIVCADLVPEAARAAMDLHGQTASVESHCICSFFIEDLLHNIDLDKVIACAEGTDLLAAARLGALRDT